MTHVKFNARPVRTFDHLLDEFLNFPTSWNTSKENGSIPPVNIFESKDAYHLELNVPGRNKEDFKVNIEKGLLTITYEKQEEKKAEEYKTIRREFGYKNFTRSFTVDERIDAENILAKYENGILTFLLPKKEEKTNETKQIAIQ